MNSIETVRLEFRLYTKNERQDFIDLLTDPEVMKYVDKGVLTKKQASTLWQKLMMRSYPSGVDTIWAVFAGNDGRYVGNASIRPRPERVEDWEIGYYLKVGEWGKGFATEIACRLVRYGFQELALPAVFATVDVENVASRKVLEKAGLRLFGEESDEVGVFCVYRREQMKAAESGQ